MSEKPSSCPAACGGGGMRACGRGLDAPCHMPIERGIRTVWFFDAHLMLSTIHSTIWSGRPNTGVMSCKARFNGGDRNFVPLWQSRTTLPLQRWR